LFLFQNFRILPNQKISFQIILRNEKEEQITEGGKININKQT